MGATAAVHSPRALRDRRQLPASLVEEGNATELCRHPRVYRSSAHSFTTFRHTELKARFKHECRIEGTTFFLSLFQKLLHSTVYGNMATRRRVAPNGTSVLNSTSPQGTPLLLLLPLPTPQVMGEGGGFEA